MSSASAYMTRNVAVDPVLRARLAELSRDQARDLRLATALEEGRSPGLRAQLYAKAARKRELKAYKASETTEEHW